jgi:hypothetical protein
LDPRGHWSHPFAVRQPADRFYPRSLGQTGASHARFAESRENGTQSPQQSCYPHSCSQKALDEICPGFPSTEKDGQRGAQPIPHLGCLADRRRSRSLQCLLQHASELTHVCLEMLIVRGQPARLTAELDPEVLSAARASRLQILPILTNLADRRWDTDAAEGLIRANNRIQSTFVEDLTNSLQNVGASGVLVDWQGIDPSLSAKLVEFLGRLHLQLRKEHLQLWLSIPVGEDLRAFDLEDLPGAVDHLVAQPHDENARRRSRPRRFQRVLELGAPCLAGTACARLRQAKRAQQRLVDPGQLSANTFVARTEGVEVRCSRPFPCFLPLSRSDS